MDKLIDIEVIKDSMDLAEIMQMLDISESIARQLIKSKFFPSIKIGKSYYLVPRTAFLKFITDPEKIVQYKIATIEAQMQEAGEE